MLRLLNSYYYSAYLRLALSEEGYCFLIFVSGVYTAFSGQRHILYFACFFSLFSVSISWFLPSSYGSFVVFCARRTAVKVAEVFCMGGVTFIL